MSLLSRCGNRVQREGPSRAEIAAALKLKIDALALAALHPEGEFETGGGGVRSFQVLFIDRIERCADEALALVDELSVEHTIDENGFLVTVARHAGEGPEVS